MKEKRNDTQEQESDEGDNAEEDQEEDEEKENAEAHKTKSLLKKINKGTIDEYSPETDPMFWPEGPGIPFKYKKKIVMFGENQTDLTVRPLYAEAGDIARVCREVSTKTSVTGFAVSDTDELVSALKAYKVHDGEVIPSESDKEAAALMEEYINDIILDCERAANSRKYENIMKIVNSIMRIASMSENEREKFKEIADSVVKKSITLDEEQILNDIAESVSKGTISFKDETIKSVAKMVSKFDFQHQTDLNVLDSKECLIIKNDCSAFKDKQVCSIYGENCGCDGSYHSKECLKDGWSFEIHKSDYEIPPNTCVYVKDTVGTCIYSENETCQKCVSVAKKEVVRQVKKDENKTIETSSECTSICPKNKKVCSSTTRPSITPEKHQCASKKPAKSQNDLQAVKVSENLKCQCKHFPINECQLHKFQSHVNHLMNETMLDIKEEICCVCKEINCNCHKNDGNKSQLSFETNKLYVKPAKCDRKRIYPTFTLARIHKRFKINKKKFRPHEICKEIIFSPFENTQSELNFEAGNNKEEGKIFETPEGGMELIPSEANVDKDNSTNAQQRVERSIIKDLGIELKTLQPTINSDGLQIPITLKFGEAFFTSLKCSPKSFGQAVEKTFFIGIETNHDINDSAVQTDLALGEKMMSDSINSLQEPLTCEIDDSELSKTMATLYSPRTISEAEDPFLTARQDERSIMSTTYNCITDNENSSSVDENEYDHFKTKISQSEPTHPVSRSPTTKVRQPIPNQLKDENISSSTLEQTSNIEPNESQLTQCKYTSINSFDINDSKPQTPVEKHINIIKGNTIKLIEKSSQLEQCPCKHLIKDSKITICKCCQEKSHIYKIADKIESKTHTTIGTQLISCLCKKQINDSNISIKMENRDQVNSKPIEAKNKNFDNKDSYSNNSTYSQGNRSCKNKFETAKGSKNTPRDNSSLKYSIKSKHSKLDSPKTPRRTSSLAVVSDKISRRSKPLSPRSVPENIDKYKDSLKVKDPVIIAMKACEAELKPLKETLCRVKSQLRNLNMPELNCILNGYKSNMPTLNLNRDSIQYPIRHPFTCPKLLNQFPNSTYQQSNSVDLDSRYSQRKKYNAPKKYSNVSAYRDKYSRGLSEEQKQSLYAYLQRSFPTEKSECSRTFSRKSKYSSMSKHFDDTFHKFANRDLYLDDDTNFNSVTSLPLLHDYKKKSVSPRSVHSNFSFCNSSTTLDEFSSAWTSVTSLDRTSKYPSTGQSFSTQCPFLEAIKSLVHIKQKKNVSTFDFDYPGLEDVCLKIERKKPLDKKIKKSNKS